MNTHTHTHTHRHTPRHPHTQRFNPFIMYTMMYAQKQYVWKGNNIVPD